MSYLQRGQQVAALVDRMQATLQQAERDAGRSMAGDMSGAGCATACDKKRISAPRTELARLPSACTTSGAVPPRTNTTSAETAAHALGQTSM